MVEETVRDSYDIIDSLVEELVTYPEEDSGAEENSLEDTSYDSEEPEDRGLVCRTLYVV